ncbi:hypothetical protein B0H17DRAFT_1137231 [Mycena rosella]|uniref:Uncharacterized protein n=1 Tax=Mycena rosella TaxID=1033263 RepID=A0AAD7D9M0_MYCRO|nr:hypothetical protein B0H17DRAFT_1137231 [Mycena rosella]
MAGWWSEQSNGKTIFYKLPEHLTAQYKVWKSCQLQQETMVATPDQRKLNEQRIRSSTHSAQILPAEVVSPPGRAGSQLGKKFSPPTDHTSLSRPRMTETTYTLATPTVHLAAPFMNQPQQSQATFVTWDQAGSCIEPTTSG